MSNPRQRPDLLGAPYLVETIDLRPDDEGAVEANLVYRPADPGAGPGHAVLYVHGFADYFFQTELADWWCARGYDFYALDLRKYGRSLLDHQTPNYAGDLREYFEEIDAAWSRIVERDRHHHVVFAAHSTGALVASLWSHARKPGELTAMVLNSPWFDLQGSPWMRTLGTAAINRVGSVQPKRLIPRKVDGFYAHSLHRDFEGEWDYDLAWKPEESWPIYFGWMRAIRQAHRWLHAGLSIPCPVLVLTSGASHWAREMSEKVHTSDVVLDVAHMRRWAPMIASHVTLVAIEGARHDVVLSRAPVRARAYAEMDRWLTAYVAPADTPHREMAESRTGAISDR